MLNTTYPVWCTVNEVPAQYPWMAQDEKCDVCVIGGGITGALCALRLAQSGADTVLITRDQIASGGCAQTMPVCQYDLGISLCELERNGRASAFPSILRLGKSSLDELERLAGELEPFGFERTDAVLYAAAPEELDMLAREYEARVSGGIDCAWLDGRTAGEIFRFQPAGAVIGKGMGARLDPFLLTHACCEAAVSLGVRIYENTAALCLDRGRTLIVDTSTRRSVCCDRAVIASGAESVFPDGAQPRRRTAFISVGEPGAAGAHPSRSIMRTLSQPSMTFALSPDGRPCAGGLCTGIVDENGMLGSLRLHGLCNRRFEVLAQSAREVYSTGDAPFPYSCVVSYPETADAMPIVHEHREHPECISAVVPAVNGIAQAIAAARTAAQKCITD